MTAHPLIEGSKPYSPYSLRRSLQAPTLHDFFLPCSRYSSSPRAHWRRIMINEHAKKWVLCWQIKISGTWSTCGMLVNFEMGDLSKSARLERLKVYIKVYNIRARTSLICTVRRRLLHNHSEIRWVCWMDGAGHCRWSMAPKQAFLHQIGSSHHHSGPMRY